jgi:hypothetical protein
VTNRAWLALIVLAPALALAGLAAAYVKWELAEPEAFAARSVEALRSKEVRRVIAEQVAVEMLERGSPDLVASRPLVLTAVEAVLETEEFARVLRRAAIAAHGVLLRGDRDVIVELEEAGEVLIPALESVSLELARQIPTELSPRIAEIRAGDGATWAVRVVDGASAAALPLLMAASAAFGVAVAYAPDRRRAGTAAGLALVGGAAGGLVAMAALRAQVLSNSEQVGVLSGDDARAGAGATWDALAGGLEEWLLIMGIAGLLVAAGASLSHGRVDRRAVLQRTAEIVAGGNLSRPLRVARGLGLA